METNETILKRTVVAFDEKKKLGGLSDLRVDCDAMAVSHYVVGSPATGSQLVLPLAKSLGVGDTFMTVQTKDDLLAAGSAEAKALVNDGFRLVGCEVYSRGGDKLGEVSGYGFDPVTGEVASISLKKGDPFDRGSFMFFSPEFVFVDDGRETASDLRSGLSQAAGGEDGGEEGDVGLSDLPLTGLLEEVFSTPPEDGAAGDGAKAGPERAGADPEVDASIAELREYLLGKKTSEPFESPDGRLKAPAGTLVTGKLLDEAEGHDALVVLAMCVED